MSQGAYVTLVGYVAQEPSIRTTKTGKVVTELRVGIAPRYRDRATGEWRDAESSYFSVSCWERLAHHVRASMHKGEPVLVRGRFRTDTFEDKDGRPRTETKITADVVGHDLSRGVANYIRQRSKQQAETESMADGSDAIADWPLLNALVNTASGASWVSIHHGGGVGIGRSIHAGQVCVADGSELASAKLERVLTNDPAMGVIRHTDAGYDQAAEVAAQRGVRVPMAGP